MIIISKDKKKNYSLLKRLAILLFVLSIICIVIGVLAIVWIMNLRGLPSSGPDEFIPHPKDTARVSFEAAWNNNSKVSFVIKNRGRYTFSKEEVSQFELFIDENRKDVPSSCLKNLNEPGTVCQIDTDVDFPTIVGSDGEVFIQVKPPFGRGGAYNCAIRRLGDKTC